MPGGVSDIFTYQLTDGDGDTTTATLTISIANAEPIITSIPTGGDGTIVSEAGLPEREPEPAGSDPELFVEETSGVITFDGGDGPLTVQISGVTVTEAGQVINTPSGTLTVTSVAPGAIGYLFVLTDNTIGDLTSVTLEVTVIDVDGDSVTSPLTITILDDVPTAVDDAAQSVAEDAANISGNVLANDTQGADGATLTSVTLTTSTGTVMQAIATSGVTTVTTSSGEYTFTAAGDWTFNPNANLDNAEAVNAGFSYIITEVTTTHQLPTSRSASPTAQGRR